MVDPEHTSCAPPYVCPVGYTCPGVSDCTRDSHCDKCDDDRVSIGSTPCTPCTEPGKVPDANQMTCVPCAPGTQPNERDATGAGRVTCLGCEGNRFSTYGISCEMCTAGKKVNEARNGCDDIADSTTGVLSDPAIVTDVLATSNVMPQTTLELTADAAVLVAGSVAQAQLTKALATEMAAALELDTAAVSIFGVRAGGETDPTGVAGRRRAQAIAVAFDMVVDSDDPGAAIANLAAQLNDPSSALMQGAVGSSIDFTSLKFAFICPVGMYRPPGDVDCKTCSGDRIPSEDLLTCIPCPSRQSPDPRTVGTTCTCAPTFYNSTRSLIKCYNEGQYYKELPAPAEACMPCGGMDCIDCDAGHTTRVSPGWATSTSVLVTVRANGFNAVLDQRALYPCHIEGTCNGLAISAATDLPATGSSVCAIGTEGPLCGTCAPNWSRPGLHGECEECSDTLSILWIAFGSALAIFMATGTLYFVSGVDSSHGNLHTVIVLGKIAVSMVQILTQVGTALQLEWPQSFRWFVDLLKVFSFDFLGAPSAATTALFLCLPPAAWHAHSRPA